MSTWAEQMNKKYSGQNQGNSSWANKINEQYKPAVQNNLIRLEEEKRKKQEEQMQKEQQAINDFNARQQEIQGGNIFTKAVSFIKEQTGHGDVLPKIDNSSPQYSSIQQAQEMNRQYKAEVLGRTSLAFGADTIKKNITDFTSKKKDEFQKSVNEVGVTGTAKDLTVGASKNIGEMISGGVKLGSKIANNFLLPGSNYANLRKIIDYSTGKPIEQVLDRNTPEYQKKVNAFIDENGVFNYHPSYANEIQKTGGDIAEIGSWFIPITRVGKVAKAESKISALIKDIPKVAEILSIHPSTIKVVKTGSKFAYEISKDIVDISTLDAIRGKDWDTIKEDATYGGIGGAGIRTIGGAAEALSKSGLVTSVADKLKIGKELKIKNSVEQTVGKLSEDESTLVSKAIQDGRPIDDISTEIMNNRANSGEDIIKAFEDTSVKDTAKLPSQEIKNDSIQNINENTGGSIENAITNTENKPNINISQVKDISGSNESINLQKDSSLSMAIINKEDKQPKEIKLPAFEGTGRVKERGATETLNTKLNDSSLNSLKEKPEYKSVNFDEMGKYGDEIIKSNKEDIIDIISGKKHDPKITPEIALLSTINTGDTELISRAFSEMNLIEEGTTMGQRIASWAQFSPDSAPRVFGEISQSRIAKVGKEKIASVSKKLEKEVRNIKPKLKIEKAQALLDELTC